MKDAPDPTASPLVEGDPQRDVEQPQQGMSASARALDAAYAELQEQRERLQAANEKLRAQAEELARREREFRGLTENAPDAVFRLDGNLQYLYMNPAAEPLAGLPAALFRPATSRALGLVPAAEAQDAAERFRATFEAGRPSQMTVEFPRLGGIGTYEIRLVPERAPDGPVQSVLVVARDVTDRVRAEEALRAANERLQSQAEDLHAANEELQTQWEELQIANEELHAANEELQTQAEELASANATLVASRESERKALRRAEAGRQMLDALMEYVPEGITIADAPNAQIRRVSRYGQRILGAAHAEMTAEEVAARWAVYYPDGVTPVPAEDLPLVRAIRTGEVVANMEVVQVNEEGESLPLLCNAGPILGAAGEVVGGVVAWRDISERKRADEERERLLAAEKEARAEAEEANRSKDQFVALISHELRTPINAITVGLHLLRGAYPTEGRAARALGIVERNVALQGRLVEDLLDLSRLQRGRLELHRAPVELDKVVAAACAAGEENARQAGLIFTCHCPPGLQVIGDFDRLQQVVTNLVGNAVKFTPAGGAVTVTVEGSGFRVQGSGVEDSGTGDGRALPEAPAAEPGPEPRTLNPEPSTSEPRSLNPEPSTARITVADTGAGIETGTLERLFDMFFQGRAGARKRGGLGMGLALVKGLVEQHGGRVWAESDGPGEGSRFIVELPLARQAD